MLLGLPYIKDIPPGQSGNGKTGKTQTMTIKTLHLTEDEVKSLSSLLQKGIQEHKINAKHFGSNEEQSKAHASESEIILAILFQLAS